MCLDQDSACGLGENHLGMLKHFDASYMLTIRRRMDLAVATQKQFNFPIETVFGFDCRESGLMTANTYELDHPGTGYRIPSKAVAILLGHVMIWQICLKSNHDRFLILEDDATVVEGWDVEIDRAMDSIPDDWDMLHLSPCCYSGRPGLTKISGRLHRVMFAMSSLAYIIKKGTAERLLRACEKVYTSVDIAVCLHAIPNMNTYALIPRIMYEKGVLMPE